MAMFVFLINDKWDNKEQVFHQSYVIDRGLDLVNVFTGKPLDEDGDDEVLTSDFYGVYVKETDYHRIDHEHPYIFLDVTSVDEYLRSDDKEGFVDYIRNQME
jgi:hypothetical protein